jgi:DNA-binding Lrp family transcriptional regulator
MSLAFVLINTIPDKMEDVLEHIKEIESVEEAYMLYGVYDIMAEIKSRTSNDTRNIVLRIRSVKGVTSTLTLMPVE